MKGQFDIVRSDDPDFRKLWEQFSGHNSNAGPFYSYHFLLQMLERAKSLSGVNRSFVVTYENRPQAIVPLILEQSDGIRVYASGLGFNTFYGPLVSLDLGRKLRSKARDFCFAEIDRLAHEDGVAKTLMTIDPLGQHAEAEYCNYLISYGYLDASIATQVLDIGADIAALKSDRRASYKALVNKGCTSCQWFIMDRTNTDYALFEAYRELHAKTAGRVTRSKGTFDIQFDMIKRGEATLIVGRYGGRIAQMNFYQHLNGWVYYSSGADDPELADCRVPVQHAIMWQAVEYFKKCGYRWFELGWQSFGPQIFEVPSDKELTISFFKRGFGGRIVPLFRGIKYYDKEYMQRDLAENMNKLMDGYWS